MTALLLHAVSFGLMWRIRRAYLSGQWPMTLPELKKAGDQSLA